MYLFFYSKCKKRLEKQIIFLQHAKSITADHFAIKVPCTFWHIWSRDISCNKCKWLIRNFFYLLVIYKMYKISVWCFSILHIYTTEPINCQCCPHIETSQLICSANQLAGFCMRTTLAINGLNTWQANFYCS